MLLAQGETMPCWRAMVRLGRCLGFRDRGSRMVCFHIPADPDGSEQPRSRRAAAAVSVTSAFAGRGFAVDPGLYFQWG